jgi:hypothetical protein
MWLQVAAKVIVLKDLKIKLHGFGPLANYADP